ncbi:hypothetical protein AVEN_120949-1 [Araneus ventricosus]|uniref:Uncharacterized protein n=1 Tax=Araneus ventricosus TaxID=182803 RepID=A0A4Y2EER3_ARAVE|nr:hypothetical protein AVEN_120949-1 [Araneus ventricosus]
MPFVPSLFFSYPFKSKNYAGHSWRFQRALSLLFGPPIPHPHTADFRISIIVARSQSRQNLCLAATLAARPSKESDFNYSEFHQLNPFEPISIGF